MSMLSTLFRKVACFGTGNLSDLEEIRCIKTVNTLNFTLFAIALFGIIVVYLNNLGIFLLFTECIIAFGYLLGLLFSATEKKTYAKSAFIYTFEFNVLAIALFSLTNTQEGFYYSFFGVSVVVFPFLALLVEVSIPKHVFLGIISAGIIYLYGSFSSIYAGFMPRVSTPDQRQAVYLLSLFLYPFISGTAAAILLRGTNETRMKLYAANERLAMSVAGLEKSEQHLKEYQKALKVKNEEIISMTESIVHDLGKPLSAIKTVHFLMNSTAFDRFDRRYFEALSTEQESIRYMEELLGDLRQCASLESGNNELCVEDIPLGDFLMHVKERMNLQLSEKKIDLVFPGTGAVRADRKLLDKIFMNLIGNAIAYIGTPALPCIQIAADYQEENIIVSITDNGIGIPEGTKPHIFKKFQRGTNAIGIHGTGLGLAITKAAVEKMGGKIWFESIEGSGTTFYVSLPVISNSNC